MENENAGNEVKTPGNDQNDSHDDENIPFNTNDYNTHHGEFQEGDNDDESVVSLVEGLDTRLWMCNNCLDLTLLNQNTLVKAFKHQIETKTCKKLLGLLVISKWMPHDYYAHLF